MTTVMGDHVAELVTALQDLLDGRGEAYTAGAHVGTRLPSTRVPESPQVPYVLVASDAPVPVAWPVLYRDTVRITAWHGRREDARDLAALCQGLLVASYSGPLVRHVWAGSGPLAATDSETGLEMASVTVGVSVRLATA